MVEERRDLISPFDYSAFASSLTSSFTSAGTSVLPSSLTSAFTSFFSAFLGASFLGAMPFSSLALGSISNSTSLPNSLCFLWVLVNMFKNPFQLKPNYNYIYFENLIFEYFKINIHKDIDTLD